MAMEFEFSMDNIIDGVAKVDKKALTALNMFASTKSEELEAYAKLNKPWRDRTGAAKALLTSNVEDLPDRIRITLSHGVDYGIWLELANDGNYSIIKPTINIKSPEFFEQLQGLLEKMGK